jgi:hypothetical protein
MAALDRVTKFLSYTPKRRERQQEQENELSYKKHTRVELYNTHWGPSKAFTYNPGVVR